MACRNAHSHRELAESARLCIAAGADINAMSGTNIDARTALMCASDRSCCTKTVQSFLHNGVDVLIARANDGMTALHLAAAAGYINSCEGLLARERGLVHIKDTKSYTALLHAVKTGPVETVKVLLQHDADIKITNLLMVLFLLW
jgi:uncharacterized protein